LSKTDTVSEPLTCRFCKETVDLGVWLYEAEEPEKMFMCHDCWRFITSLIDQLIVPMLRENLQFAEDHLRECSVFRNVRVEATTE